MKKDRNCSGATPYPIYQPVPQMIPPMIGQMPMQPMQPMQPIQPMQPMQPTYTQPSYNQPMYSQNTLENQVANLTSQMNNLERRVAALEGTIGTNLNNYNTSNFQMM